MDASSDATVVQPGKHRRDDKPGTLGEGVLISPMPENPVVFRDFHSFSHRTFGWAYRVRV